MSILTSLALFKQDRRLFPKYLEQANIIILSKKKFLMDEFNILINKNIDIELIQYTVFESKKIAELLEKIFFKVDIAVNILTNAQIFNCCFVDK